MKYDPISRRFFLQGLGTTLAIPFLPSLLPKAYAATAPLRYVQMATGYGIPRGNRFFPSDAGMTQVAPGVFAKPLSSIAGDLSYTLGPAFTPYKNQISLVRGLHSFPLINHHNNSLPTCAAGARDEDQGRPLAFPYSVDSVLSESNKVYPNANGMQRLVNACPYAGGGISFAHQNFSWNKKNGQVINNPMTTLTSDLLNRFPQLTNGSTPQPVGTREKDIMQAVYQDYVKVRDSRKLSSVDKARFEGYMQLVDELQKAETTTPAATCAPPSKENEGATDFAARARNQLRIIAAALSCQLTNVVNFGMDVNYGEMHKITHRGETSPQFTTDQYDQMQANYKKSLLDQVGFFIGLLAQLQDVDGKSVLDNTLVYVGHEYGELLDGFSKDDHQFRNMGALLAGGAGGRFQMGQYVNYASGGGYPIHNLLVSIFNAFGLNSTDYRRDGVVGFGQYDAGRINAAGMQAKTTPTERVKPLPYLYKGVALG